MSDCEIGLFAAKTHLSEIVQRVEAGERFFITRRGTRIAELRPVTPAKRPLERGSARSDAYFMADDFDEPLADLADYM
jgi:prevent-host-death family protein